MAAEEREKPVSAHIGAPSPRLHRDLQEDCRNGRRKSAPADAAMSFIPFNCGNESLKMPAEIRDTENLIDQEDEHRIRSRCWSGEILSEPVRQAVPLLHLRKSRGWFSPASSTTISRKRKFWEPPNACWSSVASHERIRRNWWSSERRRRRRLRFLHLW